jgi:hypothetical protein
MPAPAESNAPYTIPAGVGAAAIAGLVIALLGEGLWNVVAWSLVASPVLAVGLALVKNRKRGRNRPYSLTQ